jgi:NTP pyrophosphatase (non-canonical NTP hydrolase)
MDNIGIEWETPDYKFKLSQEHVTWIMQNAKASMYNENRSYIYNKAFYEAFFNPAHTPDIDTLIMMANNEAGTVSKTDERFDLIREWAASRGLYDKGNSHTQYVKLQEEAGELAKALLKNDKPEVIDAIGDIVVVLTNLAHLEGYDIEYCIDEAYKVIAARTGKMINGTFVKDAD